MPLSATMTANPPPTDAVSGRLPAGRGCAAAVVLAASLMLVVTGCSTPFVQPSVEVPTHYATVPAPAEEPEVAWWDGYGDPVLADLIRRAANENRDVRIAAERVRAARAGVTISRSWLYPNVGVGASGLDFGTGYGSGCVRLLVLTDVASSYFTLTGALRQLETVRAISAAQDETLRLVTARRRVGLATPFDVERAQTEASRARAAIPPLETVAAVSRHRIAILIGDQAFNAASVVPWQGEAAVPAVQAGQPSTLLQRRPDLLALKAQLEAANWRRQQAMAEWFPRLFLGALFGRQSVELNAFDLGTARFNLVSGLLSMPVFNAGRTQAINEVAESGQAEALYRYEDGIVRALEDVENALVALRDERQRSSDLQTAAASAQAALGRAQSLYDRGQIDLLPLLDAQRARLATQVGANDSETQLRLNSVRLYKALGGGWQAFEPAANAAQGNAAPVPKS